MNINTYVEDTLDEFGVTHVWQEAKILDKVLTKRGTCVEIIERPKWGIACYMDNSIQSCTVDEQLYHESLVHPVMSSVINPKRVCIFGGGEGATAREVLKWPSIEKVDMYEWDPEIVNLFKDKYPRWAKGAWDDPRLNICHIDVFEAIKFKPEMRYDVIIIDLFEPAENNLDQWRTLLMNLNKWVHDSTAIGIYAGMRNILVKGQPYQKLIDILNTGDNWHGININSFAVNDEIIPYKVFIPSFSGESMFILLKNKSTPINFTNANNSHITDNIWQSYCTLNW